MPNSNNGNMTRDESSNTYAYDADAEKGTDADKGTRRGQRDIPIYHRQPGKCRLTLEAAVAQVPAAGGRIVGVVPTDVGRAQAEHEPRKLAVLPRPQDQVPLVGQEAPGRKPQRRRHADLAQQADERVVIGFL